MNVNVLMPHVHKSYQLMYVKAFVLIIYTQKSFVAFSYMGHVNILMHIRRCFYFILFLFEPSISVNISN